ncbi:MAG TPA: pyridoxamine 5'-phosphate oxidase [Gammaproteobacteria bacterium]|jgi:pyridoxamine 5'-phosphate oxidase
MSCLPQPAPEDPLPLARQWLTEAEARISKNPWAMALATVARDGRISVRYVLLKELAESEGYIVFYTNYASRKASELESAGRAAGALYWPDAGRQLRLEGKVERSPAAESDSYFASRPRASQLNAWASEQSRAIDAPDSIVDRLATREAEFAEHADIPRPAAWGGYRLQLDAIEFWVEGMDRFHERLCYRRSSGGDWSSSWLQP